MEREKLLIIPFLAGLMLMLYSWYLGFPLSVSSVSDSFFNHIPILYWISIPLVLVSMFLIAFSFKNIYWKWIMSIGFVTVLYSLSYFYFTMSTIDADFFRGLTENFIRTNNLDASQIIHGYYQWPSFFLLAKIATLISGVNLITYEFLIFTIIGIVLSSGLFVYASRAYPRGGFLAVSAFFVVMFLFLNYQAVPFSLAFAILIILFMLETTKRSVGTTVVMIVLFISMVLTHLYSPLFFIIYLLTRSIIGRSRQYFELFMLTLIIYLIVQITLAVFSFTGNIQNIFNFSSEYSSVTGASLSSTSIAIDAIPHLLSRYVTIAFAILSGVGFAFLIIMRKNRKIDLAIFLTGVAYSALGAVLFVLGSRAIPLLFIPIAIGVGYLFESKLKKYLKYLYLLLLIFVVFVPIHSSINGLPTTLQTKENLATANFAIEKYDWNSKNIGIADSGTRWYLLPQIQGNTQVESEETTKLSNTLNYHFIIYSIDLAKSLQVTNISSKQIIDKFDVVYNSGFSYFGLKADNLR